MTAKAPGPRATLERRTFKVVARVATASSVDELKTLIGPRVAERHPLAVFQTAAREILAEQEARRAERTGEPLLSEAEQAALGVAASRLLGLAEGGSPLTRVTDEELEAVRTERDPAELGERLGTLDPEGPWPAVPRFGGLTALAMVAASAESERRYRIRAAETAARIRALRAGRDRRTGAAAASSRSPAK